MPIYGPTLIFVTTDAPQNNSKKKIEKNHWLTSLVEKHLWAIRLINCWWFPYTIWLSPTIAARTSLHWLQWGRDSPAAGVTSVALVGHLDLVQRDAGRTGWALHNSRAGTPNGSIVASSRDAAHNLLGQSGGETPLIPFSSKRSGWNFNALKFFFIEKGAKHTSLTCDSSFNWLLCCTSRLWQVNVWRPNCFITSPRRQVEQTSLTQVWELWWSRGRGW